MKIDLTNVYENPYLKLPFEELVELVFFFDGERKIAPRAAVQALILRLEQHYGYGGFGNANTGDLLEWDAYLASMLILSCNQHV